MFAFLFSAQLLFAQSALNDVVYLRNGSILHGKILESVTGEYTKIEIIGHNILVLPQADIEKVILDELVIESTCSKPAAVEVFPAVSFYGGSKNSAGFTILTSYRFPSRLSAGAGMGVDWFSYQVMPMFAEVSYTLLAGNLSPFIYVRGGYAIPLGKSPDDQYTNTSYKGGVLAGTGIGLRRNFSNHNAFVFSAGYRYQQLRTVSDYYNPWYGSDYSNSSERIEKFNRIGISIGFLFD